MFNKSNMTFYSVSEYMSAGCPEFNARSPSRMAYVAVHGATDGKVCDTGCYAYNNGSCPAYKKLTGDNTGGARHHEKDHRGNHLHDERTRRAISRIISSPLQAQPVYTETVKQQAARMGISIAEVRRLRNPN